MGSHYKVYEFMATVSPSTDVKVIALILAYQFNHIQTYYIYIYVYEQLASSGCIHSTGATDRSPKTGSHGSFRTFPAAPSDLLQHLNQSVGDGHAREPLLPTVCTGLRVTTQTRHQGQVQIELVHQPVDIRSAVRAQHLQRPVPSDSGEVSVLGLIIINGDG